MGQLKHYSTTKNPLAQTMKHFEALVLMIVLTNNVLLSCEVAHGDRLLFQKTRHCLLSMAKMEKLGFGPILALFHSQKTPCRGHETFRGLSTCDRYNKQCTTSMSNHSWGLFFLSKKSMLTSLHGKNDKTGFWANFSSLAQRWRPFERPWNVSRTQYLQYSLQTMHCLCVKSLMGVVYSSSKPDFVFFPWHKWQNCVLGQL